VGGGRGRPTLYVPNVAYPIRFHGTATTDYSKVKKAFGAIFNAGVGFSPQPSLVKLGETRDHQA
jgi:hypothetical protein